MLSFIAYIYSLHKIQICYYYTHNIYSFLEIINLFLIIDHICRVPKSGTLNLCH